jgi:hypothetical protein
MGYNAKVPIDYFINIFKETSVSSEEKGQARPGQPKAGQVNLGDEIMEMLSSRTKNPSEAFVLIQQLSVFLWAQFKIDWHEHEGHAVAGSRKQRYLDFVSGLIDQIEAQNTDSEQAS